MSYRPDNKRAALAERPEQPTRSFRRGQIVRFVPPEAAYPPSTAQAAVANQTGEITHVWNDDYANVNFGERDQAPLLINTSYLKLESSL